MLFVVSDYTHVAANLRLANKYLPSTRSRLQPKCTGVAFATHVLLYICLSLHSYNSVKHNISITNRFTPKGGV